MSTGTRGVFFGGVFFFAFLVLVLSPPWQAVRVLDFNVNCREYPCRWLSG